MRRLGPGRDDLAARGAGGAGGAGTVKREHRALRKLAQQLGMSDGLGIMLCITENIHGLAYAQKAASDWVRAKEKRAQLELGL